MEPHNPTRPEARDEQPTVDLARRRLLIGAAAGALTVPLLGRVAEASQQGGDGDLIREPAGGVVSGVFDPRFRRVRDQFVRNFTEPGEGGAAVSIFAGGRRVVDL